MSPGFTLSTEKLPLKSVLVPFVVFLTMTLTPGKGSLEFESVTDPVIVPCCPLIVRVNPSTRTRILNI